MIPAVENNNCSRYEVPVGRGRHCTGNRVAVRGPCWDHPQSSLISLLDFQNVAYYDIPFSFRFAQVPIIQSISFDGHHIAIFKLPDLKPNVYSTLNFLLLFYRCPPPPSSPCGARAPSPSPRSTHSEPRRLRPAITHCADCRRYWGPKAIYPW